MRVLPSLHYALHQKIYIMNTYIVNLNYNRYDIDSGLLTSILGKLFLL